VPIGMPTVCLKNTTTKHNKYIVNPKFEHFDDISFRELFGRVGVVFCFSVSSFNNVFVSTLVIRFYETQLDNLSLFVFQHSVGNSCVEDREVKCFNAIAGERPGLYDL